MRRSISFRPVEEQDMSTTNSELQVSVDHHLAGRVAEAEAGYRRVLALAPDTPDALHLLGVVLAQRNDGAGAAFLIRQAIALRPEIADYYANLGNALRMAKELDEAVGVLRRAVALQASHAGAWANLAGALVDLGRYADAEPAARAALSLMAEHPDALHHLGLALAGQGRHSEAAGCFSRVVAARPQFLEARIRLASALTKTGQLEPAIAASRAALELAPGRADLHLATGLLAWQLGRLEVAGSHLEQARTLAQPGDEEDRQATRTLGAVRHAQGRLEEAAACFRAALGHEQAPVEELVESGYNLGKTLGDLGDFPGAEAAYRAALARDPENLRVLLGLGRVTYHSGRIQETVSLFTRAVTTAPTSSAAHFGLGLAWRLAGAPGKALTEFEAAWRLNPPGEAIDPELVRSAAGCERDLGLAASSSRRLRAWLADHPDHMQHHRALLLSQLYDPEETPDSRFAEHRRFAARHGAGARTAAAGQQFVPPPFTNSRDPDRVLRIGYLSSDMRDHVVAGNMLPVVDAHNRQRQQIFLYSLWSTADDVTQRFQASADGWRTVATLDDAAVAAQIRADEIDVLVSLAIHFDANRPLVCTWRAAPVQVSFLDPLSSGLDEMDYLIGDPVLCPRPSGDRFSERVVRLPSYYLESIPAAVPEPVRRPGEAETPPRPARLFGSFNNPGKIGPPVLDLWARLLAAVPEACLLFKYRLFYADSGLRERVIQAFAARGVGAERLVFIGRVDDPSSYFGRYCEVDVALDPFPMSGANTTFDALAMGLPVVTWPQAEMASRWSASILRPLGLDAWIARDADSYIAIAARLIRDPERLALWRRTLRGRLAASPICNGRLRAAQLERIYRALWRRWCRTE